MSEPTVYPCHEHGAIRVPLDDLIVDGKLSIFPEVQGKGYFDIDFRDAELVLKAKNHVGLIPINSRVQIHVTPKVPIANLLYLVQRAKRAIKYLPGFFRSYKMEPLILDRAEELFARALLECLLGIERGGLLRRYVPRETSHEWRGRVLFAPTIARHISKGDRFHQVRLITDFTSNIPENQLLKDTILRVLDRVSTLDFARAKALAEHFDTIVIPPGIRLSHKNIIPNMIHRLPATHKFYERSLWLCYLIANRYGLCLESFGPAHLESVTIDLASVFEDYVRNVISDGLDLVLPGGTLRDGNPQGNQRRLFAQGKDFKVAPDIYLLKEGVPIAVLDAKYKLDPTREDRYEILAFCEALQVKRAIFLSPLRPGRGVSEFFGMTPGGIEMHEVRIDLAAADIFAEEAAFVGRLGEVLGH